MPLFSFIPAVTPERLREPARRAPEGSVTIARAVRATVALPVLLGVIALVVLVGGLFGWHPLWSEPDLTLAEAAALKDRGTMQRLISEGVDPNAPAMVRAGILEDDELFLTPLEASVGTRTPVAMEFLLAHGARMDPKRRSVIVCLAFQEDAREILDFLGVKAADSRTECDDVVTPW
jgi:hypothetical protein